MEGTYSFKSQLHPTSSESPLSSSTSIDCPSIVVCQIWPIWSLFNIMKNYQYLLNYRKVVKSVTQLPARTTCRLALLVTSSLLWGIVFDPWEKMSSFHFPRFFWDVSWHLARVMLHGKEQCIGHFVIQLFLWRLQGQRCVRDLFSQGIKNSLFTVNSKMDADHRISAAVDLRVFEKQKLCLCSDIPWRSLWENLIEEMTRLVGIPYFQTVFLLPKYFPISTVRLSRRTMRTEYSTLQAQAP